MKKSLVGLVFFVVILAGCGTRNNESSNSSTSTKAPVSSTTSLSSEESASSVEIELSTVDSSSETTVASSEAPETEESSFVDIIDTKNLTKAQVEDWIAAYIVNSTPQYKENGFTREDFGFAISPVTSGEISIRVEENHSTPKMRAAGADPATSPLVGNFQITNEGFLAKQDPVTLQSQVVATDYYTLH